MLLQSGRCVVKFWRNIANAGVGGKIYLNFVAHFC